ncbi:hypothetical protein HYT24_00165 [Candidatus Pacearchaeota archaeon]|nr:hypothetical protein [Candidatus Pacearchaeota archaeon]
MINKKGIAVILLIFLACFLIQAQAIEVKSVLLKFSLHKGESITKNFSISSIDGGEIKLQLKGTTEGVRLMDNEVVLDSGEEKNVEISFDAETIKEGVYVGHIELTKGKELQIIPVIFEVESKDVFFDANLEIPVKYSEIMPGEKILVQLNVFDLNAGTKRGLNSSSLDVEYTVHDLNGNNIISEHENFVVDGQVTVSKTMNFPKDIKEGQYVFSAVIKYRSSVGIASELFTISKTSSVNFNGLNFPDTGLILIFISFIFLTLILFFVYIIRDRDKMFLELRQYNNDELARQKELLNEQAKIVGLKSGVSKEKVKKEIKEKIEKIKKKQRQRVDEYRKLKKDLTPAQMKAKLEEWKRKGYNTTLMELKLRNLSTNEMKSIMQKWKEKYKS